MRRRRWKRDVGLAADSCRLGQTLSCPRVSSLPLLSLLRVHLVRAGGGAPAYTCFPAATPAASSWHAVLIPLATTPPARSKSRLGGVTPTRCHTAAATWLLSLLPSALKPSVHHPARPRCRSRLGGGMVISMWWWPRWLLVGGGPISSTCLLWGRRSRQRPLGALRAPPLPPARLLPASPGRGGPFAAHSWPVLPHHSPQHPPLPVPSPPPPLAPARVACRHGHRQGQLPVRGALGPARLHRGLVPGIRQVGAGPCGAPAGRPPPHIPHAEGTGLKDETLAAASGSGLAPCLGATSPAPLPPGHAPADPCSSFPPCGRVQGGARRPALHQRALRQQPGEC